MANTDRARKLLVRSALVTSATIATFIGAQNLAMLDTRQLALTLTPASETASIEVAAPVEQVAPTVVIQQAAPSIIILRQSGQSSGRQPANNNPVVTSIQPPAPVELAAPAPVIVQQPVPQTSRSSR